MPEKKLENDYKAMSASFDRLARQNYELLIEITQIKNNMEKLQAQLTQEIERRKSAEEALTETECECQSNWNPDDWCLTCKHFKKYEGEE